MTLRHFHLSFVYHNLKQETLSPEELIEMQGIIVAEIHQETRIDFEDMIESLDENDFLCACQQLSDDMDELVDKCT